MMHEGEGGGQGVAVVVVCGGKKSGGRMAETKRRENCLDRGRASDSFLHGDARNKRADWLKGQDARTGWRGKGERGGGYKNVKRALQPFSRRSAGGH